MKIKIECNIILSIRNIFEGMFERFICFLEMGTYCWLDTEVAEDYELIHE